MKNILCFGDSNTFGTNPLGGRHPRDVRWTGILQQLLGEDYYVIEEGFGGRTTVWDDPYEENRCGKTALPIALHSHKPLDLVILCLGTNDCKEHFHASAYVTSKGAELLCNMIRRCDYGPAYPTPQILLISPIHIGDDVMSYQYKNFGYGAPAKSRELGKYYKEAAERVGCLFLDASTVAVPSQADQLHMDPESHRAFAEAVYEIVKNANL